MGWTKKYGLDEYSRYVEIDGERICIEAYPFSKWHLDQRITQRYWIIKWHAAMLLSGRSELRKY